jgi:gamma-glutamyltranspeptidase / glutathione hydrolase / leukotriene-C4 hydrolase
VPGELRGLAEAHARWGALPWARVVLPAAELAAGWPVSTELALRIRWPFFHELMFGNADFRAVFAPEGRLLAEGETIRRTNLSWTLTTVAEKGADAFYEGPIADSIVEKVRSTGGILTREDMKNYSVIVRKALEGTYRDRKVGVRFRISARMGNADVRRCTRRMRPRQARCCCTCSISPNTTTLARSRALTSTGSSRR